MAHAQVQSVWEPDAATLERANLTWLMQTTGIHDFRALHKWSVTEREEFWRISLERVGAVYDGPPERILDAGDVRDPTWLEGARLNAVATCWRHDADRTAIIAGGEGQEIRHITFGDLRAMADAVSNGLVAAGLRRGDAVALYLPMNVECVAAYLGIVQAGMAVVSIPDSFAAGEVATRLRLSDAQMIITVDAYQRGGKSVPMYPKAAEAASAHGARVVVIGGAPETQAMGWDDLLRPGGFTPVACHPQDVTNILFSSGTTGDPKAIPWTHLTPFKAAIDGHWHQDIHEDDVVAWPTNIGWMMGPWLIYASLMNGAPMALYEGVPTSASFIDFVRHAKVTVLGLVPAIVRAWRGAGVVAPGGLPAVRVFSSTGEASNARDYAWLMSLADAPIIEYCGGTEIGGGHLTGTVVQPSIPATFSTPAMGIDFVLIDEAGILEGPGMGELFLIPPSLGLSQRLLNRDHHAEYYEDTPKGPDGVVLRRHGDEVERLPNGYYAAQGRADDTMNLGGIKVGSIELERVMDTHPAVRETAAVAVRPEDGGADQLVVFVVPGHEAAPEDLQSGLQDLIKQRLNPLFRIHDVRIVEALPRTASNKVMRRELRAQYQ